MNVDIEKIQDFLMDLDSVVYDHDINVDIIVCFAVSESRVKPMGNPAFRQLTERKCPKCGNTVAEGEEIEWCTYIYCEYIAKKR